jgi:hypothetical protein
MLFISFPSLEHGGIQVVLEWKKNLGPSISTLSSVNGARLFSVKV